MSASGPSLPKCVIRVMSVLPRRYAFEKKNRPADRFAAGFVSTGPTRKLQHDLTPMRARVMLDQVNGLPRSQHQFALQDRDLQRGRRQHGLDMRGHIVGALGVV